MKSKPFRRKLKRNRAGSRKLPSQAAVETSDAFSSSFRLGTHLLHEGKVEEATPVLERAYRLDPTHVDAALNLAGAYILSKQFSKAVVILEPLSRRVPDNAMIWTNLGAAYLGNPILAGSEEQLQAIAAFKRALAIDPIAPHVAYNLGLIYRDRQETDQAIAWFRRALQANPHDQDARALLQRLLADGGHDEEE